MKLKEVGFGSEKKKNSNKNFQSSLIKIYAFRKVRRGR
jgi:hypothetical protein